MNPPVLFVACLFATGMLQLFRPVEIAAYPFAAGLTAGGVFIGTAVAIGTWAIWEMKRQETPLEPGSVPRRLVTSGPFRFTRNPLYLSQLLVVIGIALAVNSVWFLAGTAALLLLLDRLIVVREEAILRQTFGPDYASYAAIVRRWL